MSLNRNSSDSRGTRLQRWVQRFVGYFDSDFLERNRSSSSDYVAPDLLVSLDGKLLGRLRKLRWDRDAWFEYQLIPLVDDDRLYSEEAWGQCKYSIVRENDDEKRDVYDFDVNNDAVALMISLDSLRTITSRPEVITMRWV